LSSQYTRHVFDLIIHDGRYTFHVNPSRVDCETESPDRAVVSPALQATSALCWPRVSTIDSDAALNIESGPKTGLYRINSASYNRGNYQPPTISVLAIGIKTILSSRTDGSQTIRRSTDNADPSPSNTGHTTISQPPHFLCCQIECVQSHLVVQEPQDGGSDNECSRSENSANNTTNSSARVARASARRPLSRNNSLSSCNGGDDGGEERPPSHGYKIPGQCENDTEPILTPAQVVSKLEPHNIHISLDESNVNGTFIGRLSRHLMDTFSNMTLFSTQHHADASLGPDSTFSLNISVASVNEHDITSVP
jgi:hypothetical protein